ncbi:phage tail protein [Pseudomonas aeruginosa]
MPLQITITDAGRAEIINAENTGTGPVVITEIAFGTGQYAPSKTQPALQVEVKRLGSIAGQAVAADTIHVMAKDEGPDAYNVGEFGLFSSAGTLIAVYSQPAASGWIIQKSGSSTLLLATDIILESLDATSLTFGDILFINPPATTEVQGVVELATDVETQDGLDGVRAVTPAGLKSLTASLVRAGLVQLVNTLTSSSQSMALTAAMGKKLQDEKQPLDATLTALAAVVTAADKLIYATGVDTFATATLTAFARSLLDDADAATARTTLGAQTLDATLTALSGLVVAADKMIYATAADTFTTATLTAFARTLLDDADAATARATLGAAPLASPTFTGTPAGPTAAVGTSTTQLASTAFVSAEIANDTYLKAQFADRVTSKGGNANGSYRVWASGRKDMIIGAVALTAPSLTLTLPIALSTTIGANARATILGGAGYTSTLAIEVLSTTQIRVYCAQNCNVMIELNGDIA